MSFAGCEGRIPQLDREIQHRLFCTPVHTSSQGLCKNPIDVTNENHYLPEEAELGSVKNSTAQFEEGAEGLTADAPSNFPNPAPRDQGRRYRSLRAKRVTGPTA